MSSHYDESTQQRRNVSGDEPGGILLRDFDLRSSDKGAAFSDCRVYRYALWRRWSAGSCALFIGLNPSTADETQDDPTIRRCIRFAADWGYSALCMANLFALWATDPTVMLGHPAPVGPGNDAWLSALADGAGIVVAAWGANGGHRERDVEVLRMLPSVHHLVSYL